MNQESSDGIVNILNSISSLQKLYLSFVNVDKFETGLLSAVLISVSHISGLEELGLDFLNSSLDLDSAEAIREGVSKLKGIKNLSFSLDGYLRS